MTIAELRDIALKLKGVTEDIKWGSHLCFSIGNKMFLVTSLDLIPLTSIFKVPLENFDEVISRVGFSKDPHLGRHCWVHLDDINRLKEKEWEHFIKQSYQLVTDQLSNKMRRQLGL
jgi:predicted DNA-binding protein (MmcQ/YjbR family)